MKAKTGAYFKKNSMAIIKNALRLSRAYRRSICKKLVEAGEVGGWKQYKEAEVMIRENSGMPKPKFIPVLSKRKVKQSKPGILERLGLDGFFPYHLSK